MCTTAGPISEAASASRKRFASSSVSGLKVHPRGLREKIWKVSQSMAAARSTARAIDPAIETCTPTFYHFSTLLLTDRASRIIREIWSLVHLNLANHKFLSSSGERRIPILLIDGMQCYRVSPGPIDQG